MKKILLALCCSGVFAASAQRKSTAVDYRKYADKLMPVSCLSVPETKNFRIVLISLFKKDERFAKPDSFFGSDEGTSCFPYGSGHLVDVEYDFGAGGSITKKIILTGAKGAWPIVFNDRHFPYPRPVSVRHPAISKASGGLITITGGGYREDDASCCPGYEVIVQCRIEHNRFVFIRLLKFSKSKP